MAERVVTRFAPSPTGFMHVGGVRTALYAWLYARQHTGTFILRIEDTDKEREVQGSVKHIMDSLRWLGLQWDQGPDVGGPHIHYVQSQRLASYREYAQRLVDKGQAYPDPYSKEELDAFREKAGLEKRPFLFREHRPDTSRTWDGTTPLRFKVPEIKRYTWTDLIRGELSAGEEALDDFVLIKADGYPTYNFAHIVDDIEMGVTHVMRGEEFISSMPKFLAVYEALGVKRPAFATLPPILGASGTKKLSKRDGAKDVLDYRAEGYIPEALCNFLALLGWHPEDGTEVMDLGDLIKEFKLERVQKSGARFDEVKLLWLNREHLKRLSDAEYAARLQALFGQEVPYALVPLVRERADTLGEAARLLKEYDFLGGISYDGALLLNDRKITAEAASNHLHHIDSMLEHVPNEGFNAAQLKDLLWPYATSQGRGDVLWPLRVALSGKEKSPDPFTLAQLLGKEKARERIAEAIAKLYN